VSSALFGTGALALSLLFAAAPPPAAPPPGEETPPVTEAPVIESIEETTVGDLDGTRVPMGNVTNGSYTLPDGTEKRGPICSLALPGQIGEFVGAGSVVTVDGTRWEVTEVVNPAEGLGSVTLKMLEG
jgi:hypothetical protein